MTAKLADGVPFTLGMTIYKEVRDNQPFYKAYTTSPETHWIDEFVHQGQDQYSICRIGSGMGADIASFYSHPNAILQREINLIQAKINDLQEDIDLLKAQFVTLPVEPE